MALAMKYIRVTPEGCFSCLKEINYDDIKGFFESSTIKSPYLFDSIVAYPSGEDM